MIAALGDNLELGGNNKLLWHLPDDFLWFIEHTRMKPLIMGRKTMQSLGKPLKNRCNIVLTSALDVLPGFLKASNWDEALDMAKNSEQVKEMGATEILIIGGGDIYKQGLAFADRLYITQVHESFAEADTFFPIWEKSEWLQTYHRAHEADEKHSISFDFYILEKPK